MPRFGGEPTAFALLILALIQTAGCSPEVLLATTRAAGGSAAAAGTGGAPAGGSGGSLDSPAGEAGAPPEPGDAPRLLADSVADFALEQGKHGWYYGYDEGSSTAFAEMTRLAVITSYEPASGDRWDCWANDSAHWTQLFQLGGHPNGIDTSPPSPMLLQRAIRRWVSTFGGDVRISGELAKIDVIEGSNGVTGSVVVDGQELYSADIAGDDSGGLSYELSARVGVGSTVDFVLDPLGSDDHHDLTRFTGVVERAESQAR